MGKTAEYALMKNPTLGAVTADTGAGMHTTPQTLKPHQGSSISWCHKKTKLLVKSHKQDQSSKQFCMNNALKKKKKSWE